MFVLITGKPRSGKSAYAVDHMLNKKKEYYNIYANVNGLKMHDNIRPLNFEKLMETVGKCKDIYDYQISNLGNDTDLNTIDEPIIQFLLDDGFITLNPDYQIYLDAVEKRKKQNSIMKFILNNVNPLDRVSKYKPTLIIIDEAQNHLPAKDKDTGKAAAVDPVISWWISYHGHLYMDVFILSQNYHKIHPTYIYDIEYFLDAMPSSKMLFGSKSRNFLYKHHIATPFNNKNLAGKKKIKKRKEIFEAYESGDQVRTKSVVLPYVGLALLLLVLVVLAFKFIISNFTGADENTTKEDSNGVKSFVSSVQTYESKSRVIKNNTTYTDLIYLKLNCISDTCFNKEYKINLNVDDLNSTVINTQSQFLSVKKHSTFQATVTLLASKDFLHLFKGATNENRKNKGFSLIN